MLSHYSAYKVAENFRLLEALYPNRIDLGLGRAPGGMPLATRALQEYKLRHGIDLYPEQLDDLIDYLHDSIAEDHRFSGLVATPLIETVPEFWLLGSSGDSAVLAAQRGAGFAFAQFINGEGGVEAMNGYLQSFKPSVLSDKPNNMVAIFAVCAETEEAANRVASSLDLSILILEKGERSQWKGTPSIQQAMDYPYSDYDRVRIQANRSRMIVGNPEQVKAQILKLCEDYHTNEIMIASIVHDFDDKLKSYQLIAEAFK